MRSVVVFPQPEGPRSVANAPLGTSNETSSTVVTPHLAIRAGLMAPLLKLCGLIGLDDPRVYLGLTRVTFAAIGIATALGSYWLARGYGAGTLPAACGAAIFALAGPTIYFAPRAMSETASAL